MRVDGSVCFPCRAERCGRVQRDEKSAQKALKEMSERREMRLGVLQARLAADSVTVVAPLHAALFLPTLFDVTAI